MEIGRRSEVRAHGVSTRETSSDQRVGLHTWGEGSPNAETAFYGPHGYMPPHDFSWQKITLLGKNRFFGR